MFAAGKTASGGTAVEPVYIESIFSTWLYTGNGSTQTITNGIDLAGKGGLVWIKRRTTGAAEHNLTDTARGAGKILQTSTDSQQLTTSSSVNTFNSDGFFLNSSASAVNLSGEGYVSWTFRKQPKFFDVVTYTGNGIGVSNPVPHSLGSVPGCVIVKRTDSTSDWFVWHRGNGGSTDLTGLNLNSTTSAQLPNAGALSSFTSTTFNASAICNVALTNPNISGATYVAYLFAHNAGGFGLTGTDNVISCGSVTTNGSGVGSVSLGYESQWLLVKPASLGGNWELYDTMRGMSYGPQGSGTEQVLYPNTSAAEAGSGAIVNKATGFDLYGFADSTYIYIAIRRGPMKTPTTGTSVFTPAIGNNASANTDWYTAGFPIDLSIATRRSDGVNRSSDRLRGQVVLRTNSTAAEISDTNISFASQTGLLGLAAADLTGNIGWNFRRAPGFFDVVCYTGNGGALRVNHNLGVVPEMVVIKGRSNTYDWYVYTPSATMWLNLTNAGGGSGYITPASAYFDINIAIGSIGYSGANYVAYLFASCPGVSKVTNFTGNGSTQTINCGFTGGARFVMIKATSTTGNWLVFDTARGMTTSTDPWLALNSTAAESSTTGACTTVSSGFAVDESKLTGVNTNGVSYIALAIA